jgi:hypothetical protein
MFLFFLSFPRLRHSSGLGPILDRGCLPGEPGAAARVSGDAPSDACAACGGDATPGRAGEQDGDLVTWIGFNWGLSQWLMERLWKDMESPKIQWMTLGVLIRYISGKLHLDELGWRMTVILFRKASIVSISFGVFFSACHLSWMRAMCFFPTRGLKNGNTLRLHDLDPR